MSKCVACNCFLTDTELMMSKPDGLQEDMCHECRGVAFNPYSCNTHSYQFEGLTEFEFISFMKEDEESACN